MKIETIQQAVVRAWNSYHQASKKQIDSKVADAISQEVNGLFPKFEQIAFYTPDMEAAKKQYALLGCKYWTEDIVTAKGQVGQTKDVINVAHLAFNYDLGTELELIRYEAGINWHNIERRVEGDGNCVASFLSHMSYHVDDMAAEQSRLVKLGFRLIQYVQTISHTAQHLKENRRTYKYAIFDTRRALGFDIKLIERIEGKRP